MKENEIPVALPFMGELGSGTIIKHVPGIYGYEGDLIVCHELGMEALYPKCTRRYTYERPKASERSAGGNRYQVRFKDSNKLKWPEDRIPYLDQIRADFEPQVWEDHIKTGKAPQWQRKYINPTEPFKWRKAFFIPQHSKEYDCEFDVLLFARRQQYAAARNFPYWEQFLEALQAEGIRCLVAGHPDSTAQLRCPSIWDFVEHESEIMDATIWAISKAKMRVGSATGTTLLSLLCGKNVVIIMSETGHCVAGDKMTLPAGYYYAMDHRRVGYRVIAHWMEWERTIEEFLWLYQDLDKFNQDCKDWIKHIDENLVIPDNDKQFRNLK